MLSVTWGFLSSDRISQSGNWGGGFGVVRASGDSSRELLEIYVTEIGKGKGISTWKLTCLLQCPAFFASKFRRFCVSDTRLEL